MYVSPCMCVNDRLAWQSFCRPSLSCITDRVKRKRHTKRHRKFSIPYSPGSTIALMVSSCGQIHGICYSMVYGIY